MREVGKGGKIDLNRINNYYNAIFTAHRNHCGSRSGLFRYTMSLKPVHDGHQDW
jgi:hypothetical protein